MYDHKGQSQSNGREASGVNSYTIYGYILVVCNTPFSCRGTFLRNMGNNKRFSGSRATGAGEEAAKHYSA